MFKLHLSILVFAFLLIIVKENHGSLTFDFGGIQIAANALTPFKKNGDINVPLVRKMAQKYAKDNITAIVIGSFEGEGPSMDVCTRRELISAWVRAGVPLGIKIMVEVGAIAFTDTLRLVEFCAGIEVTAIFVLPELAYKAKTLNEYIEDLKVISKVAPKLPLIFHDDYLYESDVHSIEIFIEASFKIPTFVGMATDFQSAIGLRRILGPMKDKLVFVIGNDIDVPLALKLGVHLSVWPSVFPKQALKIVAAINAGDCDKAVDLQLELNDLIKAASKLKSDVFADYHGRSFIEKIKYTYKLITGWDLKQRLPLRKVDEIVATKMTIAHKLETV